MTEQISKRSARAVADVMEGMILATVDIAAPIERVFKAISDPNEIPRWWGSAELYRVEECTSDFRQGGKWVSRGHGADGTPFSVEGEYLEIDPPRKLVQTWKAEWDGNNVTTIAYRLETLGAGTRVTVKHSGFADRYDSCRSHGNGWERVLGWLETFAAELAGKTYFCRLVPPRPSFAMDMNEAEKTAMTAHVAYWGTLLERGIAVVFGPVGDPTGPWGLGVLRVRDAAELDEVQKNDPAILAAIGLRYESLPMMRAITQG